MCGIAGIIVQPNTSLPDLRERLLRMRDAMRHRGPDDAGLYLASDGHVGLVNRRLAIRDLSSAGHMPMSNADGTVHITYNGEIYNADELRAELQRLGFTFRSTSDTEVILYGYEAWGESVVERLRGMFAFAILDDRRWTTDDGDNRPQSIVHRRLLLARDRLGIKPLYYAQTTDAFVFASELKAIQASGLVPGDINPTAIVAYLMLGSVPCPLTIYNDVTALEPATTLKLPDDTTSPTLRTYWHLPFDSEAEPPDYPSDYVRGLLEDAVHARLVSDVPLGAFLSGGLDSSAVVALMRASTDDPVRTCSMVFEEQDYAEGSYARAVADQLQTEHYERTISAQDVIDELDRIVWAMDQPTIDGVNSYFVSQTARKAGLTVALSGLGGDELFGGYPDTFQGGPRTAHLLRATQRVPFGVPAARATLAAFTNAQKWTKVADALDRPASLASAYLAQRGLFAPSEIEALLAPEVWKAASDTFDPVSYIDMHSGNGSKGPNGNQFSPDSVGNRPSSMVRRPFTWISAAELRTYTHNQLLRDTDVMSMTHSLEVRVPLLDHTLVEAVLPLPTTTKQNGAGPKNLLREAVGDLLPTLVRNRREKQGFTFPLDVWLQGALGAHFDARRRGSNGVLRDTAITDAKDAHRAGRLHWSRLWALLILDNWLGRETYAR